MAQMVLFFIPLLIFSPSAFAAKVESIKNNKVTIFLETVADEEIKPGDILYLTDNLGGTKATLRVIANRGLMADTVLMSGLPLKEYRVKLPETLSTESTPPPVTPKTIPAPTTVKADPAPSNIKADAALRAVKKPPHSSMQALAESDPDDIQLDSPADSDAQVDAARREVLNSRPRIPPNQSKLDGSQAASILRAGRPNWNVSTDILSLAGLFFDYQVFSVLAERRVTTSTSIGATINFGTFESNQEATVGERPLVRRTEFGPFIRYNFKGDILDNGAFVAGSLKIVQEQWLSSGSFAGGSDDGIVATGLLGYQWMFKSITLRFGYQIQYTSLPSEFKADSGQTFNRSNRLLSGTANYAVLQFGFMF